MGLPDPRAKQDWGKGAPGLLGTTAQRPLGDKGGREGPSGSGGSAGLRAWLPTDHSSSSFNPIPLGGWIPPGVASSLSHSPALFVLLCDYATSRDRWTREAPGLQSEGLFAGFLAAAPAPRKAARPRGPPGGTGWSGLDVPGPPALRKAARPLPPGPLPAEERGCRSGDKAPASPLVRELRTCPPDLCVPSQARKGAPGLPPLSPAVRRNPALGWWWQSIRLTPAASLHLLTLCVSTGRSVGGPTLLLPVTPRPPPLLEALHFLPFAETRRGAPGWLGQLSIRLRVSPRVAISWFLRSSPARALRRQLGSCLGLSLSLSLSQNK